MKITRRFNKTQENEASQLPQPDFVKIKAKLYKNLMRLNEELDKLHQRLFERMIGHGGKQL